MDAGKLDSKITIKRLVKSPDEFGGLILLCQRLQLYGAI